MTDIERCHREIETCETLLRAGHTDYAGLLQAIQDWSAELRELTGAGR